MPKIAKGFNYDTAIKELQMEKSDHEQESQCQDYAKKISYLHGAYFTELKSTGFTHEEAFELLKIWSNNITKGNFT